MKSNETKNQKSLQPKLRFPEFKDAASWSEKTLSGISIVTMGSSPQSEYYNQNQIGLPLLQGNADIKNRRSVPRIFTSEITKECLIGDILMSVRAPVGSIAKSDHNACIGRGIAAIRSKQPNSQEFIFQWLLSFESKWANLSQGGTFDAINSDDLKKVYLPTPTPAEQQKIADCLSSLDELIEAEDQKLEALQIHKKGLMQELFPAEGQTLPKRRFPEFHSAPEWESLPIGTKVDFLSGYPFDGIDISENNQGIRLLRGINVTEGRIRHNQDIDRYYLGRIEKLEKYKIQTNDLVIPMDGSKVGKNSALVNVEDSGALLVQRVARLRTESEALIKFIYQHINSTTFHTYVDKINTSSGIPHISAKQICNFEICFPSPEEEQRIADFFSSIDDLITTQTKKLKSLRLHKKGLMQQLFPNASEVQE